MKNDLIFINENSKFDIFDNKTNTLTIKNQKDKTYNLVFAGYVPPKMNIKVINSDVIIIERYQNKISNSDFVIDVDEKSRLIRFSIVVFNDSKMVVRRTVNNQGFYQSMQIDLTKYSLESTENINLLNESSSAFVIDGIYAIEKAHKVYQTNLNHYGRSSFSNAKVFAINNDNAHVSIYTDAYIKNGAIGVKTTQEGRIINLSDSCVGIVLPNLHIDENDVEAAHSCSVGSLNKDHLYYLQTRGLDENSARNILIRGYFNPLLEEVKDEDIKKQINDVLDQRIG